MGDGDMVAYANILARYDGVGAGGLRPFGEGRFCINPPRLFGVLGFALFYKYE